MASFKSDLNELSKMVSHLKLNADDIEDILMSGGQVGADEVRKSIASIPVRDNKRYDESNKGTGLLRQQIKAINDNLGVAKMQYKNGIYDVKIGFYKGYTGQPTKKWSKGIPIQMLIRSIEKGTSWLNKTPVISKALKSSQADIVKAMQKELTDKVKK